MNNAVWLLVFSVCVSPVYGLAYFGDSAYYGMDTAAPDITLLGINGAEA